MVYPLITPKPTHVSIDALGAGWLEARMARARAVNAMTSNERQRRETAPRIPMTTHHT